jgi:hypothetical protein
VNSLIVAGLVVVAGVVVLESGMILLVRSLRREFQWLITEADELPTLDPAALGKFIATSFDPHLGWVRRPGTTGREKGKKGDITFHMDEAGARARAAGTQPPTVAAFGDSYVFCRQVEDDETWGEALDKAAGIGVMNFGVGNYGADQGLLRYEATALPTSVRVAILGFVPETVCRIQSYWKHYLEFGNTFAFKPRFRRTEGDGLALCESAMQSEADFAALREKLPGIQAVDGFYARKFRSVQFRIPYLLSFSRHPSRHATLITALLLRRLARALGRPVARLEGLPFALIMRWNIADAHRLYDDRDATDLLRRVLLRFHASAVERGHQPLVLVLPQLIDLRAGTQAIKPYQPFFRELADSIPVLDMTPILQQHPQSDLYVEDQYGGHLSARGNAIVAEHLASWLTAHPAATPAPTHAR